MMFSAIAGAVGGALGVVGGSYVAKSAVAVAVAGAVGAGLVVYAVKTWL